MTKEEILIKFKERIESGKSIKYKDIKKDDATLLYAIDRKIGGIFNCAKELGITEEDLISKYGLTRAINRRTLSEDEIKERLFYLKSIGKLTTLAMRKEFEDNRLEKSLKSLYGSVQNGLDYFGLERDSRLISKESLVNKLKELHESGEDISYSNMIENHSNIIYTLCGKMKKSWYKVLIELEIPFEAKKIPSYTKEMIAEKLLYLKEEYGKINYNILKKYGNGLLSYVHKNYDSIYDFYLEFGYNPEECMDFNSQKAKGFAFEKVFKELLDYMNIKHKYNKFTNDNTIRPDFQLDNNIWLDCKLSSWTSSIEDTINKYTPHCDKLIIVFLRGEEEHLNHIKNEKVEIKKVTQYLDMLDNVKRQHFIEKFDLILNNNEYTESVTTERSAS